VKKLNFASWYDGSEADALHDCCMPADGSLIRIRRDASSNCQYSRVTSPASGSTYSSWTDIGDNCGDVACCAYGVNVWLFYVNTSDGKLYRKDSTDSGATFGSWTDMGDIGGDSDTRIAAAAKSLTEACVFYAGEEQSNAVMTELDTGEDGNYEFYGSTYVCQTFQLAQYLNLSSIKFMGYRVGDAGNLSAWIFATDSNGKPTGSALVTGNAFAINTMTTDTAGGWYEIGFTTYELSPNTTYALVLAATAGDASNNVHWMSDSDAGYSDGQYGASVDAGSTWVMDSGYDMMFEIWGTAQHCVFRRRLSGGSWEAEDYWTNAMKTLTGVAATYDSDYMVVVTGTNTSDEALLDVCVFGDGTLETADTWGALQEIMRADDDADVTYESPSIDKPDVYRITFVEDFTGSVAYARVFHTFSISGAAFNDELWREPIPFNAETDYGLAMCHSTTQVFLTNADKVFRALLTDQSDDLTADVKRVKTSISESQGTIEVEVDNSAGGYNTLSAGVEKGSEIRFSPGYYDSGGTARTSTGLLFWITSIEHRAYPGYAAVVFHGIDGWGMLDRVKWRRSKAWAAGDSSLYSILQYLLSRGGFAVAKSSSSAHLDNYKPPFSIQPGESIATGVRRLLALTPDVFFFRGETAYVVNPGNTDSSDYTYGTDHIVEKGIYVDRTMRNNWAEVFGYDSEVIEENSFDFANIQQEYDIIQQASHMDMDGSEILLVAQALRRDADIHEYSGYILVPLNCGQEVYDVITITDSRAGLSAVTRRVLGLTHYYEKNKSRYDLFITLGAR